MRYERLEQNLFRHRSGTFLVRITGIAQRTFESIEEARAWRDEQLNKPPRERAERRPNELVATGVYRRPSGTFYVKIVAGKRTHQKSFSSLREAIAWRDEQRGNQTTPRRAFSVGINALHRSTWMPEDVREDHENARRQIASANRSTVERDGREFTVVHLPDATTAAPTSWQEPSLRQAEAA